MSSTRRRRSIARRSIAAMCAVLGVLSAGCASQTKPTSPSELLHRALVERELPSETAAPIEPNAEMRGWARQAVTAAGTSQERLELLLEAILNRQEAPFVYAGGKTNSVQEAWRTGQANCLSFSHLFVALAREIGLDAYYLRVRDVASFGREGDLVVSSDHVTAAWGPAPVRRVLDFTDRPVRDYHLVEPLTDLTALALHYSNLGAESIRQGRMAEARERLELATRIDAELADGWVNLGVARRRLGDLDGAEKAYRRALEADAEIAPAYHNLAGLLEIRGRSEEAKKLLALADRRSNRNPWSYLALGDLAFDEKRFDEAERLYRRARTLAPDNPEAMAALGDAALATGRARDAKRWLRKANALDPENPRVVSLSKKLKLL
jgi:tetratricopeptide (TPR) repeat protein